MKKKTVTNLLSLLCALCYITVFSQSKPVINKITSPADVELYELYEVDIDLTASYSNPYKVDEIEVKAEFVSKKTGESFSIPGFYYTPATVDQSKICSDTNPKYFEKVNLLTGSKWKIRFVANVIGNWTFKILVTDKYDAVESNDIVFDCINNEGDKKGFIRAANSRYIMFENGEPYYPIGINMPKVDRCYGGFIPRDLGTLQMKDIIDKMDEEGINHFRFEINMFKGLNLYGIDAVGWDNLGNPIYENYYSYFNQKDMWQLDTIVSYAKANNITMSLAVNSWQDFGDKSFSDNAWTKFNPYNLNCENPALNDIGSCEKVEDFFTQDEPKEVQKDLFRYIIARWGFATNILSFDIWDEANQIPAHLTEEQCPNKKEFNEKVLEWHEKMLIVFKSLDPYNHLINSGQGGTTFFLNKKAIESFDYYQGHFYRSYIQDPALDYVESFHHEIQTMILESKIPTIMGEFYHKNWADTGIKITDFDPHYYEIHNILWTSILSGSYGSAQFWEFKNIWQSDNSIPLPHVDYEDLDIYNGVSKYVENYPKLTEHFEPYFSNRNDSYRICMLKSKYKFNYWGWIQDQNFTFHKLFEYYRENNAPHPYLVAFKDEYRPDENDLSKIEIEVPRNGNYAVNWYSTITGENIQGDNILDAKNNLLTLSMPAELHSGYFADAAFTIKYQECEDVWNNHPLNYSTKEQVRRDANIITDPKYGQPYFINANNLVSNMWFDNEIYTYRYAILNNSSKQARGSSSYIDMYKSYKVYYIDVENKVSSLIYNWDLENPKWEYQQIRADLNYSVRHNSTIQVHSNESIYYIGNDNRIHVLWKDNGIYKDAIIKKAPLVTRTSSMTIDNMGRIYYVAEDRVNYMCRLSWKEEGWEGEILIPVEFYQDYSPIKICNDNFQVFYIGSDYHIHRIIESAVIGGYKDEMILDPDTELVDLSSNLELDSDKAVYFKYKNANIYCRLFENDGTWKVDWIDSDETTANATDYFCIDKEDQLVYKGRTDQKVWVSYFGCENSQQDNTRQKGNNNYKGGKSKSIANFRSNSKNTDDTFEPLIYPNPTNDELNISFYDLGEQKEVRIFNLAMQEIVSISTNSNSIKLNTKGITKGMYIVVTKYPKKLYKSKLIVN